jgi:hypothetical protein
VSGMLWLGGQKANVLETGNGGVTANPIADTLFPTTALYDRHPDRIFKYGSLTSAPTLTADIDMLQGAGGFESWTGGSPVGWTEANAGTGDVTQQSVSGTLVHSGLFSARFAAGDTSASVYKDVVVRAGGRYSISIALRGDAGLGQARLFCRNQNTGNYLNGGAWGAASNEMVIGPTAAAYTVTDHASDPTAADFQVESAAACGSPLTTLRFQIVNDNATTVAWADSFSLIPGVSFASVHGHNIDPRSAPTVRASTDNFAVDDDLIATPSVIKPAFYADFSVQYYRYWRLAFADTNSAAIYIGEWVLGEHTIFRGPALPLQVNYSDQQVRVPHRFGAPSVYGMGQSQLTSVPMTVRCEDMTERTAFMTEWQRTQGGYPVVVVPHDGDSHTDVIYGLMADALPHSWATKRFVTLSTEIEPLPLPLITG